MTGRTQAGAARNVHARVRARRLAYEVGGALAVAMVLLPAHAAAQATCDTGKVYAGRTVTS